MISKHRQRESIAQKPEKGNECGVQGGESLTTTLATGLVCVLLLMALCAISGMFRG